MPYFVIDKKTLIMSSERSIYIYNKLYKRKFEEKPFKLHNVYKRI